MTLVRTRTLVLLSLIAGAPFWLGGSSDAPDIHEGPAEAGLQRCAVFSTATTIHRGKGHLFISDVFFITTMGDKCELTGLGNDFADHLRARFPEMIGPGKVNAAQHDGYGSSKEAAERGRQEFIETWHRHVLHEIKDFPEP